MNHIDLKFQQDSEGKKILSPVLPESGLNESRLDVEITDENFGRIYPVFQQKAGIYGKYSEYMTRHGCACCSLTTVLAAFVDRYRELTPDRTISEAERKHFPEKCMKKTMER